METEELKNKENASQEILKYFSYALLIVGCLFLFVSFYDKNTPIETAQRAIIGAVAFVTGFIGVCFSIVIDVLNKIEKK